MPPNRNGDTEKKVIPPQLDIRARVFSLSESKIPFITYRLPGAMDVYLIEASSIKEIEKNEIGKETGFVLFPFSEKKGLLISDSGSSFTLLKGDPEISEPISKEKYLEQAELFIQNIREGKFKKLVLSRIVRKEKKAGFSAADLFFALCEKYPQAFVYFGQFPGYGMWMGASPETLISSSGHQVHIMSLAGTQTHHNRNAGEISWGEKEKEEQDIVTRTIAETLKLSGVKNFSLSKPYTHFAGHLAHLRSDFTFETDAGFSVADLITALHPTPAVGGLPQKEASGFIQQNEGHQRSLYCGFLGPVNQNGELNLFVNLRCMRINTNSIDLFAGGGITSDSVPEKEWEETEQKAKTLGAFL